MAKTHNGHKRRQSMRKNVTQKHKNGTNHCPIGLKAFEKDFSKTDNKKIRIINKKVFAKQLLSKFAPHSIKPENNFYDFINYQWLQDATLEQQQKYIRL